METLPVELLHHVFDHLDAKTIVFAVRPVSRLFLSVTRSYDRYVLDLQLLCQADFHLLYRLIRPQQVVSLIVSNDYPKSNQIELFVSHARLRHFTRLRSLTLLNIDEAQFNFILERVNVTLLTSFTVKIRKHDARRAKTTGRLFSLVTSHPHLRQLSLAIASRRLSDVSWPAHCAMRSLTINTYMSLSNLSRIVQCCSSLHTLTINNSFDAMMETNLSTSSHLTRLGQLRSLTIDQFRTTIDKLEFFLTLVPSLAYFKLVGGQQMVDGQRWTHFIQVNLPQLSQFEFYFHEWFVLKKTVAELELLISAFQTPFWIEHKRWFVLCESSINYGSSVDLYTIPICKTVLEYDPQRNKLPLSTSALPIESELANVENNVRSLTLVLNKSFTDEQASSMPLEQCDQTSLHLQKVTANHPRFRHVTDIILDLDQTVALASLRSVLSMIDVTRLAQMTLKSHYFDRMSKEALNDIAFFLAQATNLSSLTIQSGLHEYRINPIVESIYRILPRQLKHLQTPVFSSEQIQLLMERCEHLSTITFNVKKKYIYAITQWFLDHTINSICWKGHKMITVWLGKKRTEAPSDAPHSKRMKLSAD